MADTQRNVVPTSPKKPGLLTRARQAVQYTISGVTPETWFGPLQPLPPMAPPDVKGRAFDYLYGYNLSYIPRATESVDFNTLKRTAQQCDLLRNVISTRIDRMCVLDWQVRPKELERGKRPAASKYKDQIDQVVSLLKRPDRRLDWGQWLHAVLEQNLVIDAVAIYRRRTRGGKVYAWELIDGATLKVLLTADGRTPEPPSPAYQQVLKGIPAADYASFTAGDMLYYPEFARVDHAYGYSRVEQILRYASMQVSRTRSQTGWFTEGNIPEGFIEAPENMTQDQIEVLQGWWDSINAGIGAIEQRRRAWWIPKGAKYTAMKEAVLKNEFDEWIARVICFAFGEDPTPFIKQVNRATAESSQEKAEAEGLLPSMVYTSRLINRLIEIDFGFTDIEFAWSLDTEFDPAKKAIIDNTYARGGIKAIDEVRESIGLDRLGGAFSIPMIATTTGYVPVDANVGTNDAQDGAALPQDPNAPPGDDGKKPQRPGKPTFTGPTPGREGGAAPAQDPNKEQTKKGVIGPFLLQRPVLNAHVLGKWARETFGPDAVPEDEMCVTVAQGTQCCPLPGDEYLPSIYIDGGPRSLEVLPDGSVGLTVDCAEIDARWHELSGVGHILDPRPTGSALILVAKSMSHALRKAHGGEQSADGEPSLEATDVAPYAGPLLFGAEQFSSDSQDQLAVGVSGTHFYDGGGDAANPNGGVATGPDLNGEQQRATYQIDNASPWKADAGARRPDEQRFPGMAPGFGLPIRKASRSDVDNAAASADPDPSRAQIAAGNYRHGHIKIQGLDISIENAAGSKRSGTAPDGTAWSVVMPVHYGYIRLTEGADGDHVDVYVGPNPDSQEVWVVDQVDADTGKFDEHKCFVGFDSWAQCQTAYLAAFSDGKGHQRLGHVTSMSMADFKAWLAQGARTAPSSMPEAVGKEVTTGTGLAHHDLLGATPNEDEREEVGKSRRTPFPGAQITGEHTDLAKARGRRIAAVPFESAASRRAVKAYQGKLSAAFAKLRPKIAAQVREALQHMHKDVTSDAQNWVDAGNASSKLDFNELQFLVAELGGIAAEVSTDTGQRTLARMGFDDKDAYGDLINQVNGRSAGWARDRAAELVGMRYDDEGRLVPAARAKMRIDEPTRDMVRQIIYQGLNEGKRSTEIAEELEGKGPYPFSEERAALIANTEIRRAHAHGALQGMKGARDAGLKVRKEWLVADSPCDICEGNAAQGAIDLDEVFDSGDDAPPGHPRCECDLISYVQNEADEGEE